MRGSRTRRVDDLVGALGIEGISQSEVSRICARARRRGRGLPVPLARRRGVSLPLARRHVPQGPRGGRVVSMARARRDRGRADRRAPGAGPRARRRATTRARPGRASSARSSSAASTACASSSATTTRGWSRRSTSSSSAAAWQRCRVHFTRNAQDLVPALGPEHGRLRHPHRSSSSPTRHRAREQLDRVIDGLRPRFPAVAELLTRGRARPARPLHLPRAPPPPDPQHQPARAAQQGDQAPDRGRRHLPQPRRGLSAWSA